MAKQHEQLIDEIVQDVRQLNAGSAKMEDIPLPNRMDPEPFEVRYETQSPDSATDTE